ncbi:Nickel transport ATP-binding protein NikE (TC 3.A.1.5.3) [Raoultella ornithinolytica]|nr:Nickel transport ATP-binding protein NikE (TC 3.A.1.5.3) [Raoultella ornithinolytica]
MNLLNVTDVSHDYPHHPGVLRDVSLSIQAGETVALLGRSGCGKSTLARMLVGLETADHGEITWRGTPIQTLKRRRAAGISSRYPAGFPGCTKRGEPAQNGE